MARTLTERVSATKRRRRFLDNAADADAAMQQNGLGYAMQDVHAYMEARLRGEPAKRPKPVKWRK